MLDRGAGRLARLYGYFGVSHLCENLPPNARIFDAGAGLSDFGHAVAAKSEDIIWINFDVRYDMPDLSHDNKTKLESLRARASSNLTYVARDVLNLPDQMLEQPFDCGFSYYMFPHIIDNFGLKRSRLAMENVLKLIQRGGLFHTGPSRYLDEGWTVTVPEQSQIKKLAADMVKRYVESWDSYEKRVEKDRAASLHS